MYTQSNIICISFHEEPQGTTILIRQIDSAITVRIRCLRLCCDASLHMRITAWFLRGSCLIVPCMMEESCNIFNSI